MDTGTKTQTLSDGIIRVKEGLAVARQNVADFVYKNRYGQTVIEDVKSPITRKLPAYRIKKKLVKAIYGIEIQEV